MNFFIFKGAPAEGEGVALDGKGDPGLPGAPGFQVRTSEKVPIILDLFLSVSLFPPLFSSSSSSLSLFFSLYLFLTLLKIFFIDIHISSIYIFTSFYSNTFTSL